MVGRAFLWPGHAFVVANFVFFEDKNIVKYDLSSYMEKEWLKENFTVPVHENSMLHGREASSAFGKVFFIIDLADPKNSIIFKATFHDSICTFFH